MVKYLGISRFSWSPLVGKVVVSRFSSSCGTLKNIQGSCEDEELLWVAIWALCICSIIHKVTYDEVVFVVSQYAGETKLRFREVCVTSLVNGREKRKSLISNSAYSLLVRSLRTLDFLGFICAFFVCSFVFLVFCKGEWMDISLRAALDQLLNAHLLYPSVTRNRRPCYRDYKWLATISHN